MSVVVCADVVVLLVHLPNSMLFSTPRVRCLQPATQPSMYDAFYLTTQFLLQTKVTFLTGLDHSQASPVEGARDSSWSMCSWRRVHVNDGGFGQAVRRPRPLCAQSCSQHLHTHCTRVRDAKERHLRSQLTSMQRKPRKWSVFQACYCRAHLVLSTQMRGRCGPWHVPARLQARLKTLHLQAQAGIDARRV